MSKQNQSYLVPMIVDDPTVRPEGRLGVDVYDFDENKTETGLLDKDGRPILKTNKVRTVGFARWGD